jgi:hypothetical protein
MTAGNKNKVMFVLWWIFLFANILDFVSTIFIHKAESNPIFLMFNNVILAFIVFIIIKAFFIVAIYMFIKNNIYDNEQTHFLLIIILVYANLILLLAGSYNTYTAIFNSEYIDVASQISKQERSSNYMFSMFWLAYLPMVITYLTFRIWLASKRNVTYKQPTTYYNEWIRCRLK